MISSGSLFFIFIAFSFLPLEYLNSCIRILFIYLSFSFHAWISLSPMRWRVLTKKFFIFLIIFLVILCFTTQNYSLNGFVILLECRIY